MEMTAKGYEILRKNFGKLRLSAVIGIQHIIAAFNKDGQVTYNEAAYMLATAWHETAGTMDTIEEYGKGAKYKYGQWLENSKGIKYCYKNGSASVAYTYDETPNLFYGRGLVQLTWYDNYKKASEKLGIDLIHKPELALDIDNATFIMLNGMRYGWFTGRKLSDYLGNTKKDYLNARRIINGTDCAERIAKYAEVFEKALRSL